MLITWLLAPLLLQNYFKRYKNIQHRISFWNLIISNNESYRTGVFQTSCEFTILNFEYLQFRNLAIVKLWSFEALQLRNCEAFIFEKLKVGIRKSNVKHIDNVCISTYFCKRSAYVPHGEILKQSKLRFVISTQGVDNSFEGTSDTLSGFARCPGALTKSSIGVRKRW